jgi:hypothetical protein
MKTIHHRSPILVGVFILLFISLTACQKDQSDSALTPHEEEEAIMASSKSEAESEALTNDVFDDVMGVNTEVGVGGTGIFGRTMENGRVDSMPACVKVTVTRLNAPEPFPLKIVIDFGTGCTGRDGRTRSGKIISIYTGRLTVPGKSATTTFDGYKIDSISVQGTHKITNTGNANERQFTVDVEGGKISKPSGAYTQWNSHRVIIQIEGLGTPLFALDDVFSITGHASGTVKRHNLIIVWESNITEPMIKRFNCRWISKGEVKIIRRNQASGSQWVGVLDYGTGNCDNKASLKINGVSHQITLH